MMRKALTKVDRIPRIKLCPASFLKICHSVLKTLSKIRTGRKIAKIPLGLAVLMRSTDSPTVPSFL